MVAGWAVVGGLVVAGWAVVGVAGGGQKTSKNPWNVLTVVVLSQHRVIVEGGKALHKRKTSSQLQF